jgi:N-acyl homoserine lactone hydrolase
VVATATQADAKNHDNKPEISMSADYSVWVLEYSYVTKYHKSGVIYGAHNQGYVKLPYCYVLIKGNGHVAMVDVGYNNKDYGGVLSERFGVENWHSPKEVLAECGVRPEEVDTVFITHAHFDHLGNIEDFPNATFYIQERELSKWIWAMSLPDRMRWTMGAVDPADILRTVDLARQGRLVVVDGDRENVLPGIDLHAAFDSHTPTAASGCTCATTASNRRRIAGCWRATSSMYSRIWNSTRRRSASRKCTTRWASR